MHIHTYSARFLATYEGRYDRPPHYLLVPCESEAHANKLRSSLIQGGEELYPFDYWAVVNPAYWAEFMNTLDCNFLAECLLNNPDFLGELSQKIQAVRDKSNPQDFSQMAQEITQCDEKDRIWGGSLQVAEYLLDLLQTVCWMLDGVSDAMSIVPKLYSFTKNKRIQTQAEILLEEGLSSVTIDGELPLVDGGGVWKRVPDWLKNALGYLSQPIVTTALQSLIDVGVSVVTADINSSRIENIACVLFSEITCKECPYVFGEEQLKNFLGKLSLDNGPSGIALKVLGLIGDTFSLFPLDAITRKYRAGLLDPSGGWSVLCEPCGGFEVVFDFTVSPHSEYFGVVSAIPGQTILSQCTWVNNSGWGDMLIRDTSNRYRDVSILQVLVDLSNVDSVEIHYTINGGSGGSFANLIQLKRLDWSLVDQASLPNMTIPQGNSNFENLDGVRIFQVNGYNRMNSNPNASTWLRKLVFRGRGVSPF